MEYRVFEQFPDGSNRYVCIGKPSNETSEEVCAVKYLYENGHISRCPAELTAEELSFLVQVVAKNGLGVV